MTNKRVIVNGAPGKMGSVTVETIKTNERYELVGALGRDDHLANAIESLKPDIVIDFTNAANAYQNTKTIIDHQVHAVIGSSGLTEEEIQSLTQQCEIQKLGAIIAPNFSLGAILMMQCAKHIAKYFSDVEIIEAHHEQKLDAPSGTAIKTAQLIQAARQASPKKTAEQNVLPGSRGAMCSEVPIHAVRLPGFVASQQVVFGQQGENLSLVHHSINRECFMPGVLLALDKVQTLNHLVYGLDTLIH